MVSSKLLCKQKKKTFFIRYQRTCTNLKRSTALGEGPNYCTISLKTDQTVERSHFTKLAISRLIMVRFSKFKIWHAQSSDANLPDVTMTSRATRWRHARALHHQQRNDLLLLRCMTSATISWQSRPLGNVIHHLMNFNINLCWEWVRI